MRPVAYILALAVAVVIAAIVIVRYGGDEDGRTQERKVREHNERFGRLAMESDGTSATPPPAAEAPDGAVGGPPPGASGDPRKKRSLFKPMWIDADTAEALSEAVEAGPVAAEGRLGVDPPPPPPAPPDWQPPVEEPEPRPLFDGDGRAGDVDLGAETGGATIYRLDRDGLLLAQADISDAVHACYGSWDAAQSGGDGRVLVRFLLIVPEGNRLARAQDVRLVGEVVRDLELAACVRQTISALFFEPPPRGRLNMTMPLQLSSRPPSEDTPSDDGPAGTESGGASAEPDGGE